MSAYKSNNLLIYFYIPKDYFVSIQFQDRNSRNKKGLAFSKNGFIMLCSVDLSQLSQPLGCP
jgi:hypothetical protein